MQIINHKVACRVMVFPDGHGRRDSVKEHGRICRVGQSLR